MGWLKVRLSAPNWLLLGCRNVSENMFLVIFDNIIVNDLKFWCFLVVGLCFIGLQGDDFLIDRIGLYIFLLAAGCWNDIAAALHKDVGHRLDCLPLVIDLTLAAVVNGNNFLHLGLLMLLRGLYVPKGRGIWVIPSDMLSQADESIKALVAVFTPEATLAGVLAQVADKGVLVPE